MRFPPTHYPYEKQVDEWTCGAASLCMVYRSFGLPCAQEEVWPRISTPDPWGQMRGRTHRLANDALKRGLSALIIQARDPWEALTTCDRRGIRVILNQQLTPGSARRHFSVMVRADDDHVVIHDPYFGPSLKWARQDFLDLWGPSPRSPDVIGHLLIALSDAEPGLMSCGECGTTLPGAMDCPGCGRVIALSPKGPIGCIEPACPAAIWRRLFCPSCDAVVEDLGDMGKCRDANHYAEDDMANSNDLERLAGAIDQYTSQLSETERSAPPGPALDQFRELMGQVKGMYSQLLEEYQKTNQALDDKIKGAQERLKAAREKTAIAASSPPEAAIPKPKPKATKAPKGIDPLLGEKLRDKLLEEFGIRRESTPRLRPVDYGSLLDYEPEG